VFGKPTIFKQGTFRRLASEDLHVPGATATTVPHFAKVLIQKKHQTPVSIHRVILTDRGTHPSNNLSEHRCSQHMTLSQQCNTQKMIPAAQADPNSRAVKMAKQSKEMLLDLHVKRMILER